MTDYIVDASVVVQVVIQDIFTRQARSLFGRLSTTDHLHVPEFCLVECTNVLWKQVRFFGMSQPDADALIGDLLILPLKITLVNALLPRALQIGLSHQLAVYDSAYIALAEKLGYVLITTDKRQEQAARTLGVTMKAITDF